MKGKSLKKYLKTKLKDKEFSVSYEEVKMHLRLQESSKTCVSSQD